MAESDFSQDLPLAPRARAILLGASNLTLGIHSVIDLAREALGAPLEIFAALGHGRSYGKRTWVLGRGLPGILESGLWDALRTRPPLPTHALLADVGNDIGYDVAPSELASWVGECVRRLGVTASPPVVVLPPLASLETVPGWKYLLARTVLFPCSRLRKPEALARLRDVDRRLRELAAATGIPLVEPLRDWYGFDPIHFRSGVRREVWRLVLGRWRASATGGPARPLGLGPLAYLRFRADRYRVLGRERRRAQPSVRLADGSVLWLY